MSKTILIVIFSYKNIFREFQMKRFQWEQTVAATISEIFYKYQRIDDERAGVQSSLLWRQKPQLQMHGACLKMVFVTTPPPPH